jgi:hypothetical protein
MDDTRLVDVVFASLLVGIAGALILVVFQKKLNDLAQTTRGSLAVAAIAIGLILLAMVLVKGKVVDVQIPLPLPRPKGPSGERLLWTTLFDGIFLSALMLMGAFATARPELFELDAETEIYVKRDPPRSILNPRFIRHVSYIIAIAFFARYPISEYLSSPRTSFIVIALGSIGSTIFVSCYRALRETSDGLSRVRFVMLNTGWTIGLALVLASTIIVSIA